MKQCKLHVHIQAGGWAWGYEIGKVGLCCTIKWEELFNGRGWRLGGKSKKGSRGRKESQNVGRTLKKAMEAII